MGVQRNGVAVVHNGILCSLKKEGNLTFCMDGPGYYYAK